MAKATKGENSYPTNAKLVFRELNKILVRLKQMQPRCPICLDPIESRCFLNECLHSYCLGCVSEWSKTKLSCPSCGQNFGSVFHDVRSVRSYRIRDFQPRMKRGPCLLRSMITVNSYFELKEAISRILTKHDMTFDLFHRMVLYIDT